MALLSIRFLHLSDFCIGKDEHGQPDFCDKIVAHVAEEKVKSNMPDLIFLTGDIANTRIRKLTPGFRLVEDALKQVKPCAVRIVLGHLHRADGQREDGGCRDFLALPSGAALQVRPEDSLHEIGLLWGKFDPSNVKLLSNQASICCDADNAWPVMATPVDETSAVPANALFHANLS